MRTISSRDLYRAIGVNSGRIEQLLHRGIIEIEDKPGRGKSRRWTEAEARILIILCDLMELGIDARDAATHIKRLHLFHNDVAFLVLSTGRLGEIVPTSERGSKPPEHGSGVAVHRPGHIYSDIVKKSELVDFLLNDNRFASAVINLDARLKFFQKVWDEKAT